MYREVFVFLDSFVWLVDDESLSGFTYTTNNDDAYEGKRKNQPEQPLSYSTHSPSLSYRDGQRYSKMTVLFVNVVVVVGVAIQEEVVLPEKI